MRKKRRESSEKNVNKGAFSAVLAGFLVMLSVALLCVACFLFMMRRSSPAEAQEYSVYDTHYVFITDDTEREFWDEVYAAAQEEAGENSIYVERLGDSLNTDYSTGDLLRVAVNSSVDGILFCGQGDAETVALIDQAAEKGIPVVCMKRDIDDSGRQSFVGVNSYDLGMEYGKQLLTLTEAEQMEHPQITILVDDIATESMQNLVTLAIRDSFSGEPEDRQPEIELVRINALDAFSAEEAIRDIFIREQSLPDIMVCLNSTYTQCTYQAAVDYNRVGDVKILGYYSTNSILDAIEKQIIYATVEVDTGEMGTQSVRVLMEYGETGYASSYIPVRTWVIGREEAEKLLQEADEDAAD